MSIWWSLHLRCEAASVPLARRLLLGTMETAGVDPDISYDLSVALSEACANAVEHGGGTPHGGCPEAYRVTAYLDGEKCRIEVADSGPGFAGDYGDYGDYGDHGDHVDHGGYRDTDGHDGHDGYRDHGDHGGHRAHDGHDGHDVLAVHSDVPCPDVYAEQGRGLHLIHELADHVHFGNRPGRGGAVVRFDKILKWKKGAPLMAV
ncbi:ATP-binding protein [Streptomyces sp. NPDC002265]|uniref:ATP-binding protein n=1 Tax=Streptomyces sp. NPDC002265 TaxID=3154415 RepID=UPI0033343F20